MGVYKQNQTNANREETNSHQSSLPLLNHLLGKNQKNFPAVMDPGDTTPVIIIIKKIETLEPENASKIIEYFLLQEMKQIDLLRYAFGPDSLIQEFCRKAKAELSDWGHLLSKGFSSNPSARPFNTNDQLLSQSCGRNQFLDFSRNSNTSLSPSLIRDNPNSNSSLFHDGSSQFPFANEEFLGNNNPFPNLQTRSFSANDAFLESEQQRMIEARGFPMSNIQGSGQFGVEEGGFSPGSQERKYLNSKQLFFTFRPKSSFTDEDVSTYFSKFGSVVDVTIPYQKRRTFGFVTFANAETVRTLLDRDNLHFICGSRVRVKPYKEKENILQNPGTDEREDINSRKIYLTFQPYSSFTDEDVSTYFSKFGPVVDVYIPYQDQQRRMFGFVTFANAETVKTILDQGNPHCICKSPVKAKPYIEKAKILQNN